MKVHARDIMHRDVKIVDPEMPLAELEQRFKDEGVSGFPVVEQGQLCGVVSVTDVLNQLDAERANADAETGFYESKSGGHTSEWLKSAMEAHWGELKVRDIMCDRVVSVSPDASLHEAAASMNEQHVHRVLVVEDGQLVGILSSLDIVRTCGDEMVDISFKPPKLLDF